MKRLFAGLFAAAVLASACSSTPTPTYQATAVPTAPPSARPTATLVPTPTPTPTLGPTLAFSNDELAGVCDGKPIPDADARAGKIHPMGLFMKDPAMSDIWTGQYAESNPEWMTGDWTGPVLVACIENGFEQLNSCGVYTRSDGVSGPVLIMGNVDTVRVVVAQTGVNLTSKDFHANEPSACKDSFTNYGNLNGSPPWKVSTYQEPNHADEAAFYMAAGTR